MFDRTDSAEKAKKISTTFQLLATLLLSGRAMPNINQALTQVEEACQTFFTETRHNHLRRSREPLARALEKLLGPTGLPPEYDDFQHLADQLIISLSGILVMVDKPTFDRLSTRRNSDTTTRLQTG